MAHTRRNRTRGWGRMQPGYHQRTVMLRKCGRNCFLGPGKSYPICTRNTCRVNPKGVQAAFNRSRQLHRYSIASKARRLLNKNKK